MRQYTVSLHPKLTYCKHHDAADKGDASADDTPAKQQYAPLLQTDTTRAAVQLAAEPAVCTCKPWQGPHRCMRRPNAMLAKMSTNAKLEKMRPTAVAPTPCRAASCGKMGDAIENVVLTVMRHASTAAKDHLQESNFITVMMLSE
jgi:hypothetical protein